jgi:molybdopterin synthase catalytic subunit
LIEITNQDFSLDEMIKRAKRLDAGAVVTFLGTVRDDGIEMMELEAFQEIVHRIGRLSVGDNIVAIVCSAGHRDEAFQGCRYIIEEMKKRAPIWKKEIGKNGERWVGRE